MLTLPKNEIIQHIGNRRYLLCPTVYLPFYKEAAIFLQGNTADEHEGSIALTAFDSKLKTVWNCDIITAYSSEDYGDRYYCGCIWRRNMADQKIVALTDEMDDYSDDSLFNITSWGADLSFRELIIMYDDDELIKPELQRKYVWTKDEASKFIDSLLLGLPVPSIFLAKVNDQKLIVDGYQRLMTVYDFVKGIFSGDKKVFKLTNSEAINYRWRGKAFAELSKEEQRRIQSTTIHAIIFEQKHPANDSGMYKIFERINTSGRNLKPQEIRNCVYHGPLNTALMELNEYKPWRNLWGTTECDSRMTDIEFILRFFALNALLRGGTGLKRIVLKKELNSFMLSNTNADKGKIEELAVEFRSIAKTIWDSLGECSFRNLARATGKNSKPKFLPPIHPAIFDAITIAVAQYREKNPSQTPQMLTEENYRKLLECDEFIDCIKQRTTDIEKIQRRVQLAYRYLLED